jgi:fatty acid desaturase
VPHDHDHDHDHTHHHGTTNGERDPQEQEALARELGESLTDSFVEYVRGEVTFDSLVFETFQSVQDLFVIASGDYELEYMDAGDEGEEDNE